MNSISQNTSPETTPLTPQTTAGSQQQETVTIPTSFLLSLIQQQASSNIQPSTNDLSKIDDTRERIIRLEPQVEQIQKDITAIKENKKFIISQWIMIVGILVSLGLGLWNIFFNDQAKKQVSIPQQSEIFGKQK